VKRQPFAKEWWTMGTAWQPVLPVLLVAAMSLIIPLAIVLGHRHPTGALLLSGGGSLVAFTAVWLVFDGSSLLDGTNSPPQEGSDGGVIARAVLVLGALLLLAAWTLSLNAAAQARRWEWIVLLVLTGFLSFAALVAVLYLPDGCFAGPPDAFGPCAPTPAVQMLIMAGTLAGPAAVLAYRLRPRVPWRAGLPEGLIISRLGTADDAGRPARLSDSDPRAERAER
jgi:hypothetical protein